MRTCCLALTVAALMFPIRVPDDGCTGLGTTAGIDLICGGKCPSGKCESRSGSDLKGNFTFCGCNDTDQDTCCTVVIRDGRAVPYGTCPPCGASGLCKVTDNLPDGNLNEPECQPKEPRPERSHIR